MNESGGITDLGVVSGWNDVVDTGIYKYTLTTENGISGLLFVTSAPKRDGSGKDHYQVRMEAGKIYSRTGESLNIVSGRYTWQDWEEVGGGSSVSVVQSTGSSTTAVMSQKAVTDELAKKATKTELNQLNEGIMKDEGLYEDVDTYGEAYSRTSTNGEMMGYINHRIEEYAVGADAPDIFTYDEQVHTLKLAQFTVHPQEGDLSFIEQNSRGVLLDPTWSYVNFICSNEPRYFSARIGGGKCVLVDTNGETSGDHYIQLFAEAAYSASTGNIEVSIFAEYKLSGQGAENNPLYINGNLPGYLRIWIV